MATIPGEYGRLPGAIKVLNNIAMFRPAQSREMAHDVRQLGGSGVGSERRILAEGRNGVRKKYALP